LLIINDLESLLNCIVVTILISLHESLHIDWIHKVTICWSKSKEINCLCLIQACDILFQYLSAIIWELSRWCNIWWIQVLETVDMRSLWWKFNAIIRDYTLWGPLNLEQSIIINIIIHLEGNFGSCENLCVHHLDWGSWSNKFIHIWSKINSLALEVSNDSIVSSKSLKACCWWASLEPIVQLGNRIHSKNWIFIDFLGNSWIKTL